MSINRLLSPTAVSQPPPPSRPQSPLPPLHVRWMIRRDMPEVLAIEAASSPRPWDEAAFLRVLRQRNCIGMIAESGVQVVGFFVYELRRSTIRVLDFAVHPDRRRMGIGSAMAANLAGKLSNRRRTRVEILVPDDQLAMHLFLRAMHYVAVAVLPGSTAIVPGLLDGPEDADLYHFVYDLTSTGGPAR